MSSGIFLGSVSFRVASFSFHPMTRNGQMEFSKPHGKGDPFPYGLCKHPDSPWPAWGHLSISEPVMCHFWDTRPTGHLDWKWSVSTSPADYQQTLTWRSKNDAGLTEQEVSATLSRPALPPPPTTTIPMESQSLIGGQATCAICYMSKFHKRNQENHWKFNKGRKSNTPVLLRRVQ